MSPHTAALAGSHDGRLVALSILIAVVAAYAALDLAERVTAAQGHLRRIWLTGGAFAMGTGIWSMHYIGMLAYSLPISVSYDWPMVAWSLLAAVLSSAVALSVVSGTRLGLLRIGLGGLLMGLGIATMHYVGMEAMRLQAMCHYSAPLVALSVAIAIVISYVALWLTFRMRTETRSLGWRKLTSTLLMGGAIPIMHYTGMAAVTFRPMSGYVDLRHAVTISSLGIIGIGGVALTVLVIAIITSLVDRRFSAQAFELEMSEQRYRQLVNSAKAVLWRQSTDLSRVSYVNQEAESMLAYPLADWTSTPRFWLEHVYPDDRPLVESCCRAAADTGEASEIEHRMLTRHGQVVWLNTSICRVTGVGNSAELIGVMTDISTRKQAQEEAEEASRAKGKLLSEIERLNEQLKRENTRMSSELDVTRRLQRMILPREADLREVGPLDISAFSESAAEVGGDYYDVIKQDGGVFLGIGDVTGHGLESGVIALMVYTAVRTLLASGQHDNQAIFEILNRVVYNNVRRMNSDRNLTFSLLRYQDQQITISGQHEEVLVVRSNGAVERHDTLDLGFPLGLKEDISDLIAETKVPLHTGDVMVVYTDGVTEAISGAGAAFGLERLAAAVQAHQEQSAQSICDSVLGRLRAHVGEQDLLDDISLVVVKPY